jgi:hypothetical protein
MPSPRQILDQPLRRHPVDPALAVARPVSNRCGLVGNRCSLVGSGGRPVHLRRLCCSALVGLRRRLPMGLCHVPVTVRRPAVSTAGVLVRLVGAGASVEGLLGRAPSIWTIGKLPPPLVQPRDSLHDLLPPPGQLG